MQRTSIATIAFALAAIAPPSDAQLLASEKATVSQTVDGTTTTVTYFRPRARGRRSLFGSRVRWGEIWTPGANQATLLRVDKDVVIEGTPVPSGAYSVWIVVQPAAWEMVLDRDTTLLHTQGPKPRAGQIRFGVRHEKRPFMETLTWWFPDVASTGATLAMQWDTVYVPLRIGVQRSFTTTVASDVSKRVVGSYRLHLEPMEDPRAKDTTLSAPVEVSPTEVMFTIRQQGSELHGTMDPPMYKTEDGYTEWILVPGKGTWFHLGRIDKGEVVEVFDFMHVQFDAAGDRANGFEMRLPNDMLIAKAARVR